MKRDPRARIDGAPIAAVGPLGGLRGRVMVMAGLLQLGCHPPPRPDAMGGFESLRQASDGDTLRERAGALTAEADAHEARAVRAYEEERDVDLAAHEATLATLAWRTALARSQHMDHEASARAARARLATAEASLAQATRRRDAAQDALDRTRRLLATQHRLAEAEQRARTARRAGRAKSALDQVALTLVQAEAVGAAKYAPAALNEAQAALAAALDAYEAQDYKQAEARGEVASKAARQALEIAQPLHHGERLYEVQATQLLALVAESARLAGGMAVLDERGVVLRLHDLFEPRKSQLKTSARAAVQQLVAFAAAQPDLRLLVEGHADGSGKAAGKAERALEQAQALGAALVQAGLAPDRVRVIGMGAKTPIADSDTLAGRRRNRRLEVMFLRPEVPWPAAAVPAEPEASTAPPQPTGSPPVRADAPQLPKPGGETSPVEPAPAAPAPAAPVQADAPALDPAEPGPVERAPVAPAQADAPALDPAEPDPANPPALDAGKSAPAVAPALAPAVDTARSAPVNAPAIETALPEPANAPLRTGAQPDPLNPALPEPPAKAEDAAEPPAKAEDAADAVAKAKHPQAKRTRVLAQPPGSPAPLAPETAAGPQPPRTPAEAP